MKRALKLFAVFFLFASAGCGDDDAKALVDCFGESVFVEFHHTTTNRTVNYSISYSGDKTVVNVKWIFGDGSSQTTTTTSTSHTYSNAGTYTAMAQLKLKENGSICTLKPEKTVTIE